MNKKLIIIIALTFIFFIIFWIFIKNESYESIRKKNLEAIDHPKIHDLYYFKDFPLTLEPEEHKGLDFKHTVSQNGKIISISDTWTFQTKFSKTYQLSHRDSLFILTTMLRTDRDLIFDENNSFEYINRDSMEIIMVKGSKGIYSYRPIGDFRYHTPRYQEVIYFYLDGVEYLLYSYYKNNKPLGKEYLIDLINEKLVKN